MTPFAGMPVLAFSDGSYRTVELSESDRARDDMAGFGGGGVEFSIEW
jgi:hypothetical protein